MMCFFAFISKSRMIVQTKIKSDFGAYFAIIVALEFFLIPFGRVSMFCISLIVAISFACTLSIDIHLSPNELCTQEQQKRKKKSILISVQFIENSKRLID